MIIWYVFAPVLLLASLMFIVRSLLWRAAARNNPGPDLWQVDIQALCKMVQIIPLDGSTPENDRLIWDTVRGAGGLQKLAFNASRMIDQLGPHCEGNPLLANQLTELRFTATGIRILAFLSPVEGVASLISPRCPRVHARFAVQLYCQLVTRLHTICIEDLPGIKAYGVI